MCAGLVHVEYCLWCKHLHRKGYLQILGGGLVLEIEFKVLHILGKCTTTELYLQAFLVSYFDTESKLPRLALNLWPFCLSLQCRWDYKHEAPYLCDFFVKVSFHGFLSRVSSDREQKPTHTGFPASRNSAQGTGLSASFRSKWCGKLLSLTVLFLVLFRWHHCVLSLCRLASLFFGNFILQVGLLCPVCTQHSGCCLCAHFRFREGTQPWYEQTWPEQGELFLRGILRMFKEQTLNLAPPPLFSFSRILPWPC